MSLKNLLKWHKFTVQTNEFTGQNDDGSLQRKTSWVNIPNAVNLSGHLQNTVESGKRGKDNVIETYNKLELEIYWTLFDNNKSLSVNTWNRILISKDPSKEISLFTDSEVKNGNIRVFEVISSREPVSLRKRGLTIFEVYLKQIFRQSL